MGMFGKVALAAMGLCALFSSTVLAGEKVVIKDITGRDVEVSVPVDNVILGEGRQIYFVAALDRDAPFKRIVGWRDDLSKADPKATPPIRPNTRKWKNCRLSAA